MSLTPECKAYEKFALSNCAGDPFPITKTKLVRYIKFRARCSTFPQYLSHLDKHPLHGPQWFQEMNNDPDIQKLMQLVARLWPIEAKNNRLPLIGLTRHKPPSSTFTTSTTTTSTTNSDTTSTTTTITTITSTANSNMLLDSLASTQFPQVRVIEGPNAKKGFMVTDSLPTHPIQPVSKPLNPHTIQQTTLPASKKGEPQLKKKVQVGLKTKNKSVSKIKEPLVLIERPKPGMQRLVVLISREIE